MHAYSQRSLLPSHLSPRVTLDRARENLAVFRAWSSAVGRSSSSTRRFLRGLVDDERETMARLRHPSGPVRGREIEL